MTETGIVRRVDDLGRVVIPKEIRKFFNIKEEDGLEILVDKSSNTISFRPLKPSPLSLNDFLGEYEKELSGEDYAFLIYLKKFARDNKLSFSVSKEN